MKRASALLVIAIFLFASIYTVAGATKKGFGNTVFNFEKTEKSLAESVPFRDEIIALDGFGEKSYENLLTSVENSRNTTLPKFIYGLGIANVGLSNAKMIVQALGNDIEKIIHAGRQELEKIDGVGAVSG